MNTQAIKIIDEMLARLKKDPNETIEELANHSYYKDWFIDWLIIAKQRISSLPSIDIDSLQRYTVWNEKEWWWYEYHECVRYEDLKKLIKN